MKFEIEIKRETEKAILTTITCESGAPIECWLPKSQIIIEGNSVEVPEWLVRAKEEDAKKSALFAAIDKERAKIAFRNRF